MNALIATKLSQIKLEPNIMKGIGFKVASVCIFVVMWTILKLSKDIPVGELIFFRSFFALFPILIYFSVIRQLSGVFWTLQKWNHVWRGLIGVLSMGMGFYALLKLPLPEAIAIGYASPLFIVVFGFLFLHETVRIHRWSAVTIGLIGVMIILWPFLRLFSSGQIDDDKMLGAFVALLGAALSAVSTLLIRRLVKTERTSTIVLYFSITSSVIALLSVPFGWVMPTLTQGVMLVGAGFAGGLAQIFLTQCYRYAEISMVAPFEYISMVLSLAIGYMVFGDIPTLQMLIGGTIVIASGIFIIYREHRLAVEHLRRAIVVHEPSLHS